MSRFLKPPRPFAFLLLCLTFAFPAVAAEKSADVAGLHVAIWTPDPIYSGKLPLVIFSHGFRGCAIQSRFLVQAIADAGYLVVAPDHHDAMCGALARWFTPAAAPFGHPEQWTQDTYRDRRDDIVRLIAALHSDRDLGLRIDWNRLALAGHSLGGYTVLGLAGAWPQWRLPGVKAVLALSPYSQPWVVRHDLSGLTAPVMYQGGTLDFGLTPAIEKTAGAYDLSPAPKYFVEFTGAGHLAWADIGRSAAHPSIVTYSVAFLDRYVKGAQPASLLTHAVAGVARLSYDSELGRSQTSR